MGRKEISPKQAVFIPVRPMVQPRCTGHFLGRQMRKKDAEKRAKLIELIAAGIVSHPIERGGFLWCGAPQDEWAKELKVSTRNFRRMIQEPPIVREPANVETPEGKIVKYTLLRVAKQGEPPTKTPQHVANIMRSVWKEKVDRPISGKEHGCLLGLAQVWPEGCQIDIFKTVLDNWSGFMAGVKIIQEIMAHKGEAVTVKFYKYPSITVMRRFPQAAIELHGIKLQSEGKPLPASFAAVYMGKPLAA